MALTTLQRIQITARIRQDWYGAMAKTASEGLPQVDVLERLRNNFRKTRHPLLPVVDTLTRRLRGSGSVSKADLKTVGTELVGLVPANEALLIQAGESSGDVAGGFKNAADYIEANLRLRAAIVGALTKPLIYFAALIGLFLFFSFKLLPSFERNRPRHIWPADAQVLGWVADHIILLTSLAVGGLVGGVILIAYLSANWVGPSRDSADRKIPPFNLIAQINAAIFVGSLAGFISAGIPFPDAIIKIRQGSNNYMRAQCDRMQNWIRSGKRPDECLLGLPMVGKRYHWIIDVYGMSTDASQAYRTISREMLDRTINVVSMVFGSMLANVLLLFLGGCIMWIYFAMFAIADAK